MRINVEVPDGKSGNWAVETFEVSELDAQMFNISCESGREIEPGEYKRLIYYNGTEREVVMSNTPAEIRDHERFIEEACERGGNILINGLGLGMTIVPILESDAVNKITVIESSEDVIRLSAPTYLSMDKRVEIVHISAFDYVPKGRYSAVWHDIWTFISPVNLVDMMRLRKMYARHCDWQGCWAEELCLQSLRDSNGQEE